VADPRHGSAPSTDPFGLIRRFRHDDPHPVAIFGAGSGLAGLAGMLESLYLGCVDPSFYFGA
jgi:hypothetical protein